MVPAFFAALAALALAVAWMLREHQRRARAERELAGVRADLAAATLDRLHYQRNVVTHAEVLEREQAARAEAESANRLKDDFLAAVSHELRTPLNAIIGWVHLLRTGVVEDRSRAVLAIERNAFAQARLVDDLLDVSRMMKGRLALQVSAFDLRSSVYAALETIRPAAATKQVEVSLVAGDPVMVNGDAARLQQVAWNLLSNAVKFTPPGGRVTVEVGRGDRSASIRVSDTGEGIDPDFAPHIFEAFRQGVSRHTRSGLGLGLAIVRQIVELHRGSVAAESQGTGHGATFTVLMPLGEPALSGAR